MQSQLESEWCWAAVSASVDNFYGGAAWTQCKVVNAELGRADCCANGSSANCDKPWYLEKALKRVHHFNGLTGLSSQAAVKTEIDSGHPLGVRTAWSGGGAHFLVVHGYDYTNPVQPTLSVADPFYGSSIVDYNLFCTSYQGSGAWTDSYNTV
jgi:hypothetical protein